jgi:putative addiction module component (TIGR02574 family)
MIQESDSVFDLTPSEKLQLVEDLWDDLASNPEDVVIHEWQKEELDRRKDNLQQLTVVGSSWDDVKRRIRRNYER